ncbi:MAG: substrate-binding domain-containing protein [Eubacteriales bacterium]|nr:substrate-binding domain-containing protein [Eubacteriales bacterium]
MLKKRMRFAAAALAAGIAITSLAGCGGSSGDSAAGSASASSAGGDSDSIKVGVVLKTLSNPFYVTMQEAMEAKADELGMEMVLQAPETETETEKQMQIVENLVVQQIEGLILAPNGSSELVPAVKEANDADVPVVILDSRIEEADLEEAGAHIECFIGSDNYQGGQLAAEAMSEALGGSGKVAVVEGISGVESSELRVGGFKDKVEELGGLEVVASQPADWEQEQGYTVTQNILQANPDIAGIFCANDMMALGAVKAIEDAGMEEQVTVIGFDATDDAKAAISEGRMYASVGQDPALMGEQALEVIQSIKDGSSYEEEYAMDVKVVTADDIG